MNRPTWDDMLPLRQRVQDAAPGLEEVRTISGRPTFQGGSEEPEWAGSVLLRPDFVPLRKEWHSDTPIGGWRWLAVGEPTNADRAKWPQWDRVADCDPLTVGHLQELRRLGLVP